MLYSLYFSFLGRLSKDTTTSTKTLKRRDSDIEKIKAVLSKEDFSKDYHNKNGLFTFFNSTTLHILSSFKGLMLVYN